MFRFYLDNILVSDPLNWSDFTETIERDETIKGLLPKYETQLTFNNDGYKYIYDSLYINGYCKLVELKVEYKCDSAYEVILEGFIFLSDCQFNLNKCTVACDVIDNNFAARIFNNKNIKAQVNVAKSKNGSVITAAAPANFGIFSTTNVLLFLRKEYHVKELFRYLIDFMSDGLIGFESDFLTIPTTLAQQPAGRMYFLTGDELRNGGDIAPTISFQQLFEEVNKKYPISFTIIKNASGQPVMKIENDSFFYGSASGVQIYNITDLQLSFNKELLYSKVRFGGVSADFDIALGSFDIIRFFSFKDEEYHLQGECNIDKTLDLYANFIADSNIIERVTATDITNDQYDEDVFFIESAFGAGTDLTPSLTTGTNPFYYNANLTNNNVAERYSLANNIAFYLGNNNQMFRATRTNPEQILSTLIHSYFTPAILFQDDFTPPNFDTTGQYTPANGRYTSPADGVYSFQSTLYFTAAPLKQWFEVRGAFLVYDSFGTLQASHLGGTPTLISGSGFGGTFKVVSNVAMNVIAGYYVTSHIYIDDHGLPGALGQVRIQPTSDFLTTAVENGGGVYQYYEPDDYFVSKLEFVRPIDFSSYKTLKLDLSKSIEINHEKNTNKTGWIRKTIRKFSTGETTWELISNISNSK